MKLYILLLFFDLCLGTKSNYLQPYSIYNRHLEPSIDNSITLIINGPGNNIAILGNDYSNTLPNQIYINDSPTQRSKKVNLIKEGENIIKLKWNNKLSHARYMFAGCQSIISIDLTKLDASSITDISNLFYNCNSLKFVNLTNVIFDIAITMWEAFSGCKSLISIDTTNFNHPSYVSFRYALKDCISLVSLDLSNLNYNGVIKTEEFFYNDQSLLLLDLSNFDGSFIQSTKDEFKGCNQLKYINLKNYVGIDIFKTIPNNNLIICMDNFGKLSNSFSLKQKNIVNNCSDVCFQKPIILDVNDKRCYYDCPKLNDKFCNYDRTEILSVMPDGYFLNDTYNRTIDKCFPLCKKCIDYGDIDNNNCSECYSGYTLMSGSSNQYNCYEKCQNYYFNNDLNQYECSNDFSLFIDSSEEEKNEIIDNLDSIVQEKEPDTSYVINGNDYSLIISPIGRYIENSNVKIVFTECEKILKRKFPNFEFRIAQINIKDNNPKSLKEKVEYKVYNQFGEAIDLSYCQEVNITILNKITNTSLLDLGKISYFKEMGVDVFQIKDDFFNDICYSYSDENTKSDMILTDRVSDIYQNFSLCDEGCEYESLDMDALYAKCNCKIKQFVSKETKEGNLKTYILKSFLYSNFRAIKCYKIVFGISGKLEIQDFGYLEYIFFILEME